MPSLVRHACIILPLVVGICLRAHHSLSQRIIPRFETIGVNQGLSQNSVYTILQDRNGFMWFGTSNGLNRYDGERIRVFKMKSELLGKANVNFIRAHIYEDSSGRIWYANETGIYYYDPLKEKINQAHDFMPDSSGTIKYYTLLLLDDEENLWLSNPKEGVIRFSIHDRQLQYFSYPKEIAADDFVQFVSKGSNAILLYFQIAKKNYKFDIHTRRYQELITADKNEMIRSFGDQLFVVNKNKFSKYDPANPAKERSYVELSADIVNILTDSYGRMWITTLGGGLFCYYPTENKIENYFHDSAKEKSIPFDITTSLYIDSGSNLWVGTDGGGVSKLNLKPSRFSIFPLNPGDYPTLKDYFIRSIFEDDGERIWFGTLHNGLCIYDPKNENLKIYSHRPGDEKSLPSNKVSVIYQDADQTMWIGHSKGVSIFDEHRNQFVNFSLLDYSDFNHQEIIVNTFEQINSGEILVGSSLGLIQITKDERNSVKINLLHELPIQASDIEQLENGDIWMATRERGLIHLKVINKNYVIQKTYFQGTHFRSIHVDKQNPELIWLCSGAGVIRFNTNTFEYSIYNDTYGIVDNYLYGILEDSAHNFWISSNSGLYYFNRKSGQTENYTVKDGLQSNEFNARAFYEGTSGKFYFAGINGFNYFDPNEIHQPTTAPEVSIISTMVNDNPVERDSNFVLSKNLTLNYFENDLSFSFAVLDYTRPEVNAIQYKLDGWDNDYVNTQTKEVRFSNLPPGNYTLFVKGTNDGKHWGKEETLNIIIKSPFWQTSWFYAILALTGAGSIIMITRLYYKQKIRRKLYELEKQRAILQERDRISKDIHDDLGAGLSAIVITSELLKRKDHPDEFTKNQLSKIAETSRELVTNFSELIWSHNPVNDSLPKLLWYMREKLAGMFESTDVTFAISISESIPDKPVQAEWRRNIFLIAKEALHNVLKHAHAKHVTLRVEIADDVLKLIIQDDGDGFNKAEKIKTGNGLTNMERRATAINSTLEIESNNKGTTLTLTASLNNNNVAL